MHTARHGGVIYDVEKLIKAAQSLPEEMTALDLFIAQVQEEHQCWTDTDGNSLGPHQILLLAKACKCDWARMITAAPHYCDHIEKVRDARCRDFPLLIADADSVIDGMHRLVRAVLDQAVTIRIKRFVTLPKEAIIVTS